MMRAHKPFAIALFLSLLLAFVATGCEEASPSAGGEVTHCTATAHQKVGL